MTDARPEPLVPEEVDLSGYEYMPWYGEFLRRSHFNSRVSDSEFRAAANLWWSAWKEIPAASLPNDDAVLCRLADLARDMRTWRKVKAGAMAGFVLCADGRWYHSFLSVLARDSWVEREKLIRAGKKSGAVRRAKKAKKSEAEGEQRSNDVPVEPVDKRTVLEQGKREEKKEQEHRCGDSDIPASDEREAVGDSNPQPEALARMVVECQRAKVSNVAEGMAVVERWHRNGSTPTQVVKACIEARRSIPLPKELTVGYVDTIVVRITREDAEIRHAANASVKRAQDQVAAQREMTRNAAPAPEGFMAAHVKRGRG